jgi:UDP-2,4-diacetamido-2,4,6-trideoxy-beta-L-altropyranose hydrolase
VTLIAALRADGDAEIGTGHVVRCLALAAELRARGWRTALAGRSLAYGLRGRAIRAGGEVIDIPAEISVEAEAAFIGSTIGEPIAVMVADHYGIGEDWHRAARRVADRLVAVDDLADRALDVDLVVNQNLGASPAAYHGLVADGTSLLLGPSYALVRRQFAEARARFRPRDGRSRRVLVAMGGADMPDVTLRVLEALHGDLVIDVVVGSAYPHRRSLDQWAAGRPAVQVQVDVDDMASLMLSAELAIGAAGTSSWERCCLGLPAVLVSLAPNQVAIASELEAAGAAIHLGWHEELDVGEMRRTVDELLGDPTRLTTLSRTAAALVDGEGCRRVADALEA